tara:strand:+ start:250 stop:540 length:291 start_codon:yes stop_codon:yes gene_type:complete
MSRYSNTQITRKSLLPKQKKNVLSYKTTLYQRVPETNGDLHIISTEGDRLDNLAFQFYGDPSLWWYIAKANNLTALNVPAGKSLVIPASTDFAYGG